MSFIYFGNTMSLVDAATPSTGAWTVAYDSDGILKQKDEFGVITQIGAGSGGATPSLSQVLEIGNNAGPYSIEMTDGSSIYTDSGALLIDLGETILENTSLTGVSSLVLRPNNSSYILSTDLVTGSYSNIQIYPGNGTTLLPYINFLSGDATKYTVVNQDTFSYNISLIDTSLLYGDVKIIEAGSSYDAGSQNKAYVHINSKSSLTNIGVEGSVIIGGSNMTASQNNTVYLGNNVNINNEYTLPNIDGTVNQVLKTDGNGNVGWIDVTTSASNGLQVSSNEVILGGTLSQNTIIDNNGLDINIIGTGSVYIQASYSTIQSYNLDGYTEIQSAGDYVNMYYVSLTNSNTFNMQANSTGISFTLDNGFTQSNYFNIYSYNEVAGDGSDNNRMVVFDDYNQKGLVYFDDYSANFTTYSLVTKGYVDLVSNGTSGTSGFDGTSGTSGFDGTSGTSGFDGTSGTSGFDGTSGTSGFDGTSGTSGDQGIPGQTLTPLGVESDYSSMTQSRGTSYSIPTPNNLDTYILQDTSHLWIYSPTSSASNYEGWVDMGPIQGPQGLSGTNGSSGTSGVSGNDSSNSARWIFSNLSSPPNDPGSTYFFVDNSDLDNISSLSISSVSSDSNSYSDWLNEITNYSSNILFRISEVGNSSISGIYIVDPTNVTWSSNYTDIILGTKLHGAGLITNGNEYSISWVVNGVDGTSGTSGIEGTSGTSGIDGTSGTSGIDGTSGSSGLTGTSGSSGIDGTSGTSGFDGTSGTSGLSGTSGTSGLSGTSGTSGLSGTSGTSGIDGTSGTSGIDGTSGTSGFDGTSGTSGFNGTSGTSGTSGSSGDSGNTWTLGTGVPITPGVNQGDIYLDETTGDFYIWNGAAWDGQGSIYGTSGTSGNSGSSGTSGTSGLDGTSGSSGTTGSSGTSGTGTSGTSGAQGNPGESITALGIELNYSSMTQSHGTSYSVIPPNNLDAYILQDTSHFWIYNPTSSVSNYEGWVDMGEIQGPQGLPGVNGTNGTSGISGTNGTAGTSGMDGTAGTSGISGTSGLTGTSGTSGITGTDGTSGTSGLTGTSGTSGLTGTSGTSGLTGTSGTSGLTGTAGTSGLNGTAGTSGLNGTAGTSGLTGTSGTSGLTGTSGTSGLNGTSGTSGLNGTAGTSGTGTSGTSGLTGTAGTSGLTGTSGTSGLTGTSGTSGLNGTDGTSGTGTSGTSGLDGTNGTSATGTSGTSGINGTAGTSGLTGTSGTSGLTGTSGTSGLTGTAGTSGLTGTAGTSGTGIGKYTATQSFTGGVTYSISHMLNTQAIVFNMWDETTGELIVPEVKKTSVNAIDVRSSVTIINGRVVIIS